MRNSSTVKLSDLTQDQKSHLAWRIDHKTGVGLLTACRIARGEGGDSLVWKIFKDADMTERQAKIHAHKVMTYDKKKHIEKLIAKQ